MRKLLEKKMFLLFVHEKNIFEGFLKIELEKQNDEIGEEKMFRNWIKKEKNYIYWAFCG